MPATIFSVIDRRQSYAASAPFVANAFLDNISNADLLQIENEGGQIVAAVDYTGTVQFNAAGLTQSLGTGGTGLYTLNRQVIGKYRTVPGSATATVAQALAAAFSLKPQSWDIIQIIASGGNIGWYVDSLGVAHGS